MTPKCFIKNSRKDSIHLNANFIYILLLFGLIVMGFLIYTRDSSEKTNPTGYDNLKRYIANNVLNE